MAEDRGYKAEIELPTPDGKGKVDVSLSKEGKRIACEISVTTTSDWEIHNIQKCLSSGYDSVIVCTNNKTTLRQIREKIVQSFSDEEQAWIKIIEPEQLFQYLDSEEDRSKPTEKTIKGYRVKVDYKDISQEERQQKNASVSRIVREALQKKK